MSGTRLAGSRHPTFLTRAASGYLRRVHPGVCLPQMLYAALATAQDRNDALQRLAVNSAGLLVDVEQTHREDSERYAAH